MLLAVVAGLILPADSADVVKLGSSPHAAMRPVPFDSVEWTDGFWADRFEQAHAVTLPRLWELAADPDAGHVLDNMRAAATRGGEHAGTDWQDAWLYKWIEAAACVFRETRNPWIDERMDEAIALIAAAQEDDGYIATQITAKRKPRFTDPREHEVYSMGHLLTAGCIHQRMTGKDSLLNVVRIPGWAEGASATINGKPAANLPTPGQYLCMKRSWKPGDKIEVKLPMPARLVEAHPKAEHLRNQAAVMRGPVLYCLESVDLPEHKDINNVYLPGDLELEPAATAYLNDWLMYLQGEALYRDDVPWENELYRPLTQAALKPLRIRMVPYFLWNNRGPAAMSVWLPLALGN